MITTNETKNHDVNDEKNDSNMTHSLDLDEFLEVKYYLTCLDPYHKKFITICIYLQKRMSSIIRNLNTSSIEKEVQTSEDLSLGFAIALPIFCATAAVSSVIILRTYLKDLNEVVKNILTCLSIHMAMASIGAAAIMMFWNDDQEIEMKCSILHLLNVANIMTTIGNLAAVSFTKYYLASKTNKLEAINNCFIAGLIILVYIGGYLIAFVVIMSGMTSFESACIGNEDLEKVTDMSWLGVVVTIVSISIGLLYDFSLYAFLKKKNQVQLGVGQDRLVPWKSSNDEGYSYNVPIGASALSLGTAALTCILASVALVSYSKLYAAALIGSYLMPSMILIVMVGITIKAAKSQKPKPAVPKLPQFHEENEDVQDGADVTNQDQVDIEIGEELEVGQLNDNLDDRGGRVLEDNETREAFEEQGPKPKCIQVQPKPKRIEDEKLGNGNENVQSLDEHKIPTETKDGEAHGIFPPECLKNEMEMKTKTRKEESLSNIN